MLVRKILQRVGRDEDWKTIKALPGFLEALQLPPDLRQATSVESHILQNRQLSVSVGCRSWAASAKTLGRPCCPRKCIHPTVFTWYSVVSLRTRVQLMTRTGLIICCGLATHEMQSAPLLHVWSA